MPVQENTSGFKAKIGHKNNHPLEICVSTQVSASCLLLVFPELSILEQRLRFSTVCMLTLILMLTPEVPLLCDSETCGIASSNVTGNHKDNFLKMILCMFKKVNCAITLEKITRT